MGLEQTWRWFGQKDPVTLKEIRQSGATGVVTALHQVPIGEVWSVEAISERKGTIEAEGLTWSVAESIPVHEDIKSRSGSYREWVEKYKTSIRNLGRCSIDIVSYHFMPVLDWVRTDLRVEEKDGSITTRFDADLLTVFDLFILRRQGAEADYSNERLERARRLFARMSEKEKDLLAQTILLGFPGSLKAYTLEGLRSAIRQYDGITAPVLRQNLKDFLGEVIPVAEEAEVQLAIHPDDPPWSVFGLPRVVTDSADVDEILTASSSAANGITFCTGSFGAKYTNDVVEMAIRFAERINFVHLRNVSRNERGDFVEEKHLEGELDMHGAMRALVLEQKRREDQGRKDCRMPFRPDHGHLMQPDMGRQGIYPGYSLFGRMRGLAELRGLELGIRRSLKS